MSGAGTNVGGAYIMWSAEWVESKREANYSFINKNLYFLRLKYSNLRSQTNERNFSNSKLSKYVATMEILLSWSPDK
jgi:hypothetical protein